MINPHSTHVDQVLLTRSTSHVNMLLGQHGVIFILLFVFEKLHNFFDLFIDGGESTQNFIFGHKGLIEFVHYILQFFRNDMFEILQILSGDLGLHDSVDFSKARYSIRFMCIKLFSQVVQLSNEIVNNILAHTSTRSHRGCWHILHLQNKVIHLEFELPDVLFSLVDAPYQE